MPYIILVIFLFYTASAQESDAAKIIYKAKESVTITGSYVIEATRYGELQPISEEGAPSLEVHSIPTLKHGGQIEVYFNNYFYQAALLTNMLYRGGYKELSLYFLTMILPKDRLSLYLPSAWYSSYVSSLAELGGDTSSVWIFRVGKYEEGTKDSILSPGGYAMAWEAQVSKTLNSNEAATNATMVGLMAGIVRKPVLSDMYLNWEGSFMAGIKANPWARDTKGDKAVYFQNLMSLTIMTGFSRYMWVGILAGDIRVSIDQQLDMRLGGKEYEYSNSTQAGSWSTILTGSARISYSF